MYRGIKRQYRRNSDRYGLGTEKKKFRKFDFYRLKRPFRYLTVGI